jgi:hypothetical protein
VAVAGVNLSIDTTELQQLQKALGKVFDNPGLAATLKAALEKAIKPAYERLKEITPEGPTGNLKRAVAKKTKSYPKDGTAVGLIGYKRTGKADSDSAAGGAVQKGPDRAFHQWWLEYGTKPREISTFSNTPYQRKAHTRRMKSGKVATVQQHTVSGQHAYIASSFKELGEYEIVPTPRIKGQAQRVQTKPAYPRAFLKKSSKPITINPTPAGGIAGRPPVQTAWNQTQGQVAEILQRELALSLEQALAKLTYSSTGTVDNDIIGG